MSGHCVRLTTPLALISYARRRSLSDCNRIEVLGVFGLFHSGSSTWHAALPFRDV